MILQSGNQRLSATENRLLNSSQVLFGPSEVRVHPFKSFAVTHADHQLLFVNSSLVIMNDLSSLSQLRADAGLRTSTVSIIIILKIATHIIIIIMSTTHIII